MTVKTVRTSDGRYVPEYLGDRYRRPLKGYEDRYEITREGDLYSKARKEFIKSRTGQLAKGYAENLVFQVDGQRVELRVDRAIAESWVTDLEAQTIVRCLKPGLTISEMRRLPDVARLALELNYPRAVITYIMARHILSGRHSRKP